MLEGLAYGVNGGYVTRLDTCEERSRAAAAARYLESPRLFKRGIEAGDLVGLSLLGYVLGSMPPCHHLPDRTEKSATDSAGR